MTTNHDPSRGVRQGVIRNETRTNPVQPDYNHASEVPLVLDVTKGHSNGVGPWHEDLTGGSGQGYAVRDVSACPEGRVDINDSRGAVTFHLDAKTSLVHYVCTVNIRVPEGQHINLTVLG